MIVKRDCYYWPKGENRMLHIYLPEDYDTSDERYPVMYMFDGHNLFFDEDDEVFNLSTFFTYSFSESMTESQKIKTDYYLKEILGVGRYKKAFYFDFYITNVNDSWHSMLVFPALSSASGR